MVNAGCSSFFFKCSVASSCASSSLESAILQIPSLVRTIAGLDDSILTMRVGQPPFETPVTHRVQPLLCFGRSFTFVVGTMARAFDLSHVICLCCTAQKVLLLKVVLSFLLNRQFALPSLVCTVSGVEACCAVALSLWDCDAATGANTLKEVERLDPGVQARLSL